MSVDLRTRSDAEQTSVDVGPFFRETLPALLDVHHDLLAPGASELDWTWEQAGWTAGGINPSGPTKHSDSWAAAGSARAARSKSYSTV